MTAIEGSYIDNTYCTCSSCYPDYYDVEIPYFQNKENISFSDTDNPHLNRAKNVSRHSLYRLKS